MPDLPETAYVEGPAGTCPSTAAVTLNDGARHVVRCSLSIGHDSLHSHVIHAPWLDPALDPELPDLADPNEEFDVEVPVRGIEERHICTTSPCHHSA